MEKSGNARWFVLELSRGESLAQRFQFVASQTVVNKPCYLKWNERFNIFNNLKKMIHLNRIMRQEMSLCDPPNYRTTRKKLVYAESDLENINAQKLYEIQINMQVCNY